MSVSDPSGKVPLSDEQLAELMDRLAVDMLFSPEAKVIASVGLLMLQTWLAVDMATGPWRTLGDARKSGWISTFQGVVADTESSGLGSVEDKAKSVADSYAIMLLLSMWVMDEDDVYGLN